MALLTTILATDDNGDGIVNAGDYTVWRDHLGSASYLPNDETPLASARMTTTAGGLTLVRPPATARVPVVGGSLLHGQEDCLSREEALRLYTHGSAWFSNEDDRKGRLSSNSFADLAVLSDDYFTVEPDAIRGIESMLTMVGGKVVYGKGKYASLAPQLPPVSPGWSPVAH